MENRGQGRGKKMEEAEEIGKRERRRNAGREEARREKSAATQLISSRFLNLVETGKCGKKEISCPARQMH